MRKHLSVISLLVLSLFISAIFPRLSFAVEVGTCKKSKNQREEDNATHIFFTIDTGKKLLVELKGLRKDKRTLQLIDTKLKLYKEVESWYKVQIKAADKAVDRMAKDLVSKKMQIAQKDKDIAAAHIKINVLTVDVAKYKGERYQWLVYGIGGTIIVTVLGVIAFSVYTAVSSK